MTLLFQKHTPTTLQYTNFKFCDLWMTKMVTPLANNPNKARGRTSPAKIAVSTSSNSRAAVLKETNMH